MDEWHPTDDARGSRVAVGLFAGIVLVIGVDLTLDFVEGGTPAHILLEAGVMVLAALGAGLLTRDAVRSRAAARTLANDLTRARADVDQVAAQAARWRSELQAHIRGLREGIDEQFARWQLSPAENEVALLMLKGLSIKEAASVRATSERTTRQQAAAIYRKAGLAGRAELSAYFLEDLLGPSVGAEPPR